MTDISHDHRIVPTIDWAAWHKLNAAGSATLCAAEASETERLASSTQRLDTFYAHVHGQIRKHEHAENEKATALIQQMQGLRQQQHAKEEEQRRQDKEKALAKILEKEKQDQQKQKEGHEPESTSEVLKDSLVNAKLSASFNVLRSDELRDKEKSVASRRARLIDLREASKQVGLSAAVASSPAASSSPSSVSQQDHRHDAGRDDQQLEAIAQQEQQIKAIKEAAERKAASEAEERASAALFELKLQTRMRLEEDRLRRAADKVAAEAAGKQAEREHRFRRVVATVEKQRELYEQKRAALATLAEEGQRLRGLKDRKALQDLKAELLKQVAEIDSFVDGNPL